MENIKIKTEYITLGQFLKFSGISSSGGDVKNTLENSDIKVNGEKENRRGKKLYIDFVIEIDNKKYIIT